MKTLLPTFRISLFLFLCVPLPSCVTTDDSYLERDPEALGRRTGRADALAGRDDDYTRHLHQLHPSADEDDFEDAYDDAYGEAEDERDSRQEDRYSAHDYSTRQAYDAGYNQGELDRVRGLSRNPRRHPGSDSGSSSVSRAWIDGYEDGWNGR